ncbi:DUF7500 family protein [Halorubrum vacuolatum]|uniref:Uncharacterized protein n=1 Tax=Halorubrum vacuolatum TaxID=63740 RepID=A0A238WH91_HALVU|nr:hypothetical protein [Halorubrum vacuolatum]SNR45029.1 hypothetical protein SAMN06264855_10786 [Halorubrum vacuolatum]
MSDDDKSPATPDDLDFTEDERVAEIDDGRYVVGTSGRPNVDGTPPPDPLTKDSGFETPAEPKHASEREPTGADPRASTAGGGGGHRARPATASGEVDRRAVSRWLASSFDDDGFAYGFDATLHARGETSRNRMVSNDVTDTFDALVSWFAANAGGDSPPPEALGLLLVAADTPVEIPTVALKRFAASEGLSPDDSIADLIRAAEEAGGLRLE